jgi:hypothetical protein
MNASRKEISKEIRLLAESSQRGYQERGDPAASQVEAMKGCRYSSRAIRRPPARTIPIEHRIEEYSRGECRHQRDRRVEGDARRKQEYEVS